MPRRYLSLLFLLACITCAPSPKYVACSSDGECSQADPRFTYCLQRRCVECVGNSGCGTDNRCVDGVCERRCPDASSCRSGEICDSGVCAQR